MVVYFPWVGDKPLPLGGTSLYFCCTIGAVTEEMIKRYIEDQSDTPQGFKVWDETSHTEASGTPAFRPISKPSFLDEGR
jgi:hypothetical protein